MITIQKAQIMVFLETLVGYFSQDEILKLRLNNIMDFSHNI